MASVSTNKMPSRWHREPGYSSLMDCIRSVRVHGESPHDACQKLKISTRTFRRYLSASRTNRDSKFYIPMAHHERSKLQRRQLKRIDEAANKAAKLMQQNGIHSNSIHATARNVRTVALHRTNSGLNASDQKSDGGGPHLRPRSSPHTASRGGLGSFRSVPASHSHHHTHMVHHHHHLDMEDEDADEDMDEGDDDLEDLLLLNDGNVGNTNSMDPSGKLMSWKAPGWGSWPARVLPGSPPVSDAEGESPDERQDTSLFYPNNIGRSRSASEVALQAIINDVPLPMSPPQKVIVPSAHRSRSSSVGKFSGRTSANNSSSMAASSSRRLMQRRRDPKLEHQHNMKQEYGLRQMGLQKTSSSLNLLLGSSGNGSLSSSSSSSSSASSLSSSSSSSTKRRRGNASSGQQGGSIKMARVSNKNSHNGVHHLNGTSKLSHTNNSTTSSVAVTSAPVQLQSSRNGHKTGSAAFPSFAPEKGATSGVSAAGQAAILHDLQGIKNELAYLQFLQSQALQQQLTRHQAREFTTNTRSGFQLHQRQQGAGQRQKAEPRPTTWGRHAGSVNSITVLDDGQTIVTAGSDCVLRAWRDGVCLGVLSGHTDKVLCVTNLGHNIIASGSSDCTVRLWAAPSDANSQRSTSCRRTLAGHKGPVNCLCRLSDEKFASGGEDGAVLMWSSRCSTVLSKLVAPHSLAPGPVHALVCLNPVRLGERLRQPRAFALVSSDGGNLNLWSAAVFANSSGDDRRHSMGSAADLLRHNSKSPPPCSQSTMDSQTSDGKKLCADNSNTDGTCTCSNSHNSGSVSKSGNGSSISRASSNSDNNNTDSSSDSSNTGTTASGTSSQAISTKREASRQLTQVKSEAASALPKTPTSTSTSTSTSIAAPSLSSSLGLTSSPRPRQPSWTARYKLLRTIPGAHGRQRHLQSLSVLGDGSILSTGDDAQMKTWSFQSGACIGTKMADATKTSQIWAAASFRHSCWVALASGSSPFVSVRRSDKHLSDVLGLDLSPYTDLKIMSLTTLEDNRLVIGCQDGQVLTVAIDRYIV